MLRIWIQIYRLSRQFRFLLSIKVWHSISPAVSTNIWDFVVRDPGTVVR